jgi:hypothetical protein
MTFHNIKWTIHPTRVLLVSIASESALARRTRNAQHPSRLEANGMSLIESWEKAELPLLFIEHCPAQMHPIFEAWRSSQQRRKMFGTESQEGVVSEREIETQDFSNPFVRPRPGDLVFQAPAPSLFRNSQFNRFFEDLGGPLLILIGDDLDGSVMETAIDSLLSGHPIIVVTDAAPLGAADADGSSITRANSISLLASFARLMKTDQLLDEWAI